MKILINLVCGMLLLMAAGGALADDAGRVQFVVGSAQATSEAGKTRPLRRGDAVNEGDTLSTAQATAVQVRMRDGGVVAVRPDTRLKFDSFRFNGKQDGAERSTFSLLRGGFRAITGSIGQVNKQNYRVITPTATIGIRGTDHEVFVVVPGSPLAATVPAGAYDKVNRGETYMANGKGEVAILPNQMGFAGADQAPQLQPLNLNIFTVPPAPGAGAPQGGGARDNAVVDGAVLELAYGPGFMLPPLVTFTRAPITVTYSYTTLLLTGQPVLVTQTVSF